MQLTRLASSTKLPELLVSLLAMQLCRLTVLSAGTLTQNEMTVQRMWLAGSRHDDLLWLQQPAKDGEVLPCLALVFAWCRGMAALDCLANLHAASVQSAS